jgi:biotin synthase
MNLGANTHLFSFFPEQGTFLENQPQPPIESYRMVQLARYLINDAYCNSANFKYDMNGRILDFNLPSERLEKIIESGLPFLTSGCPNKSTVISCNRPYSNETPSQALKGQIRNYPFPPTDDDINLIKSQLRLYQSSLQ